MKINILLCDRFPGLLPEYIPSYASMFTRLFSNNCRGVEFTVFNALEGELPDVAEDGSVYLITGCNLSAYDDVGWIKELINWVKAADEKRLKLVGICFGHQLIAQALGGSVRRSEKGWGTGVRESTIIGEEPLRHFPKGRMRLMYNHHDQVMALPPRASLFATCDFCPVDGFTIGNHIITFQGHPEYVPQYAVHLIMDFADNEPLETRIAALKSIGSYEHDGDAVARWIVERFS